MARRNYDVPSEEEFLALGEKVSQCVERIDDLEQEVQDLKNSVRCCTKEVAKCQKASTLAAQKILSVGKAFSNTGKLSTVFKQIVEDNLCRIQEQNGKMAKAIVRLEELGVIKKEDAAKIEALLVASKRTSGHATKVKTTPVKTFRKTQASGKTKIYRAVKSKIKKGK